MNIDLISVLILSYKNLKYFKDCLNSILMQNYENIEIVFSDDGTPNFNKTDILDYINSHKGTNIKSVIINHNSSNLGIVKNYNRAIGLSKGKYIFYLGIDDMLWDEDTLTMVIKFFKETNCLICTGYRYIYDETMKKYKCTLPTCTESDYIKNKTPQELYDKLCEHNFIGGSATPFSRELINKYGYLDESYVLLEDYPRYLYLTRKGCKIYFINRPLIKYRLGGITTTVNERSEALKKDIRKMKKKEILPYR
jgi:GT2 family glycosyltransferase